MAHGVASRSSTRSDTAEQPFEQQVVTPPTQLSGASEPCEKRQQALAEIDDARRRSTTDRRIRETEAEAVSAVVAHAIGVDTVRFSSEYLSLYGADVETLRESLEHVRQCAASILDRLVNQVNGDEAV
jgi:hypothetical protein